MLAVLAEIHGAEREHQDAHRQSWPTKRGLGSAVFECIEAFYSRERRHSTLGSQRVEPEARLNALTVIAETCSAVGGACAAAQRAGIGLEPSIARAIAQTRFQRNHGRRTGVSTRSARRSANTVQSKRTHVHPPDRSASGSAASTSTSIATASSATRRRLSRIAT